MNIKLKKGQKGLKKSIFNREQQDRYHEEEELDVKGQVEQQRQILRRKAEVVDKSIYQYDEIYDEISEKDIKKSDNSKHIEKMRQVVKDRERKKLVEEGLRNKKIAKEEREKGITHIFVTKGYEKRQMELDEITKQWDKKEKSDKSDKSDNGGMKRIYMQFLDDGDEKMEEKKMVKEEGKQEGDEPEAKEGDQQEAKEEETKEEEVNEAEEIEAEEKEKLHGGLNYRKPLEYRKNRKLLKDKPNSNSKLQSAIEAQFCNSTLTEEDIIQFKQKYLEERLEIFRGG